MGKRSRQKKSVTPHSSHDSTPTSRFLLGLFVVALLTIVKIQLEDTRIVRQIEQMTLNLLQLRLDDFASGRSEDVAVVDVSGLPMRPRDGNPDLLITPRNALTEIVSAIATANPQAIGVDILFEPDADGHVPAEDARFLETCLALSTRADRPVPTFVGIHESIRLGPEHWLGEERFSPLGAAVVVPKPEGSAPTTRMPTTIVSKEQHEIVVPSLGAALARAARADESTSRWLGHALHRLVPSLVEKEVEGGRDVLEAKEILIDYGGLDRMIESRVPARSAADLAATAHAFQGKVVLVGRGTPGSTNDQFNVPAHGTPIPGVFVHAATVSTLIGRPLYVFSHVGRIVADVVAALLVLGGVFAIESWLAKRRAEASERLSRRLALAVAAMVVVCGYFWVDWTGLFWTDFLLVVIVLLVHEPVEAWAHWIGKKLERTRS